MDFFIKKNATLPVLKLQVVKDGRSDYDSFMNTIELSAIFFSMVDIDTGIPKISSRPAGFVEKTFLDPNAEPEYYIYYQFTPRDTNRVGRYEGQFMLRNDQGVLILPIREKLIINVQESFIADDLEYNACYTSEFPCCVNGPYTTTTTTECCPCTSTTTIPVTTTTTTITPPPTTSTTTTIYPPVTTSTTTLSGITSWSIARATADVDFFCDHFDEPVWSKIYTTTMDELTVGTPLYGDPLLSVPPIYMNYQSFYMVLERNDIPLVNRFSINTTGQGASVANVYHCGDAIPCRELTFTKIVDNTFPLMYYNCGGTYQSQPISFGQTVTVCGSYPVYRNTFSINIGNNC